MNWKQLFSLNVKFFVQDQLKLLEPLRVLVRSFGTSSKMHSIVRTPLHHQCADVELIASSFACKSEQWKENTTLDKWRRAEATKDCPSSLSAQPNVSFLDGEFITFVYNAVGCLTSVVWLADWIYFSFDLRLVGFNKQYFMWLHSFTP